MNIQVKKRNSDSEISRERSIEGWSKWPTRQAHDLKTAGSNPAPALHVVSRQTKIIGRKSYEYKRESHEHTGMERMKKLFSSTPLRFPRRLFFLHSTKALNSLYAEKTV